MSLDSIVNVTITALTTAPTRVGFGTPLVMSYHTVFPERFRIYTSTADMLTDGFTATHPAVRAVGALLSQNPKVSQVVVGRELYSEKMKVKVTPVELVADAEYTIELNGAEFTYVADSTPTVAEITAGLADVIDPSAWLPTTAYSLGDHVVNGSNIYVCTVAGTSAGAGGPTGTGTGITDGTAEWDFVAAFQNVSVTDNSTDLDIEADTLADAFTIEVNDRYKLNRENITPDGAPSGIADDIAAVQALNDNWYSVHVTQLSKPIIEAVAAYIETQKKIFVTSTFDDEVYDPAVTDDVMSELSASNYARTVIMYLEEAQSDFPGAGWAGIALPLDPGSLTWAYKTIAGATTPTLTATEVSTIQGKNGNTYNEVAGVSITRFGISAAGEYIDITRGSDWLQARIQENVYAQLVNLNKVPFTDRGAAIVQSEVNAALIEGVNNNFLAADPAPVVTVPLVADVSFTDRANRLLPDVEFSATLAGAIHTTTIQGTLSV